LALKLLEWIRSELRSVTIGSAARFETRGPVHGARVSHPFSKGASSAGFSMGGMCPQSGTMRNSAPGMARANLLRHGDGRHDIVLAHDDQSRDADRRQDGALIRPRHHGRVLAHVDLRPTRTDIARS